MERLPDPAAGVTALEKRTRDGKGAALLLVVRDPKAGPPPNPEGRWASGREVTPAGLIARGAGLRAFVRD